MRLNCLIVEDEEKDAGIIEKHILETPKTNLIGTCADPQKAFLIILNEDIDLIFLDILFPKSDMTGIDLIANLISSGHKIPKIIIMSGSKDHEHHIGVTNIIRPYYWLEKPIKEYKFILGLQQVFNDYNLEQETIGRAKFVFLNVGGQLIKILKEDILWIKASRKVKPNFIWINTESDLIECRGSLVKFVNKLGNKNFFKVSANYAINRQKIHSYARPVVKIQGNKKQKLITIGRTFWKEFEVWVNS